ncbi:MAG TPA: tetratricopeptide repeat protein [Spirochaetota bacterium]|nr:tetratricopeptide repeat protein [Spirochaetota bacterium]
MKFNAAVIIILFITISCFIYTGNKLNIIELHRAWQYYPSADISFNSGKLLADELTAQAAVIQKKELAVLKQKKLTALKQKVNNLVKHNDTAEGWLKAGNLYSKARFYEEALSAYKKAASLADCNSDIYNNIAGILHLQREHNQAAVYYKKALKCSKNDPDVLLNMAFLYYDMGVYAKARQYYLKAVMIDPALDKEEYNEFLKKRAE